MKPPKDIKVTVRLTEYENGRLKEASRGQRLSVFLREAIAQHCDRWYEKRARRKSIQKDNPDGIANGGFVRRVRTQSLAADVTVWTEEETKSLWRDMYRESDSNERAPDSGEDSAL